MTIEKLYEECEKIRKGVTIRETCVTSRSLTGPGIRQKFQCEIVHRNRVFSGDSCGTVENARASVLDVFQDYFLSKPKYE